MMTVPGAPASDRQALEDVLPALCEQLRPQLRRILAAFQIPMEDAEDLVQTTLLIALAKWPGIWNPTAWLLGTLQKRCIMYWRERRRRSARLVALEPLEHELSAEPPQEGRVLLAEIETLCRRLPQPQRAVVVLYCCQGLPQRDVARATGLRPSSVRKTAHRAVAQLRQAVKGRAPGPRHPSRHCLGTGSPWPVNAFLAAYARSTRRNYGWQLGRAAAALGDGPLAELTAEALAAYRAAVIADGRPPGSQEATLAPLRTFLLWAAEHGWHALEPAVIREALRSPLRRLRIPRTRAATGSPWSAPVDAFLAGRADTTKCLYARQLGQAAAKLGGRPLAELTAETLAGCVAALRADGRAPITHAQRIVTLRSFLLWTGERGWHALEPVVVDEALRRPDG
ncbi:MAG TPA: sigma-70 family RNA polymerase sigma factor [Thermoanaerobaculia bacterium]|nr:sigma-70 family RNA polymerase sigma factor [Thermoanaerobaculia bacterium]